MLVNILKGHQRDYYDAMPEARVRGAWLNQDFTRRAPAPDKIKISLDDAVTRAVWDAAREAKREVAAWPAWKRGEDAAPSATAPAVPATGVHMTNETVAMRHTIDALIKEHDQVEVMLIGGGGSFIGTVTRGEFDGIYAIDCDFADADEVKDPMTVHFHVNRVVWVGRSRREQKPVGCLTPADLKQLGL